MTLIARINVTDRTAVTDALNELFYKLAADGAIDDSDDAGWSYTDELGDYYNANTAMVMAKHGCDEDTAVAILNGADPAEAIAAAAARGEVEWSIQTTQAFDVTYAVTAHTRREAWERLLAGEPHEAEHQVPGEITSSFHESSIEEMP